MNKTPGRHIPARHRPGGYQAPREKGENAPRPRGQYETPRRLARREDTPSDAERRCALCDELTARFRVCTVRELDQDDVVVKTFCAPVCDPCRTGGGR